MNAAQTARQPVGDPTTANLANPQVDQVLNHKASLIATKGIQNASGSPESSISDPAATVLALTQIAAHQAKIAELLARVRRDIHKLAQIATKG